MKQKSLMLFLLLGLTATLAVAQYKQKGKYRSVREAFYEVEQVRELELSSINSALPDSISKFKHLKVVRLINLNEKYDLADAFKKLAHLDSLEELYLYGNEHRELPEEIALLKGVKKIQLNFSLSGNLPKVLATLSKIDSLEFLSLRGFGITFLPQEILSLSHLKAIGLADNPDMDYDQVFNVLSKMQNLEKLILDFNAVAPFPEEITRLEKLKYLDMKYMIGDMETNKVYIILSKLKSLQYLAVASDNIVHLPKEIELLKKLKELDISGNRIAEADLAKLKKALPDTQIINNDI